MAEGLRPFGFQGDPEEGPFRYDGNRYFLTSYGRWVNQGAPSSAPPAANRYAYVYSEVGPNRDRSGEEAKEHLSTRGLDGWMKFERSWDKVLKSRSSHMVIGAESRSTFGAQFWTTGAGWEGGYLAFLGAGSFLDFIDSRKR